jgi:ATP-dependent Clp protease ATP-binding subunit ClpC
MFERFTTRARHSVVLAQDEARDLQHNYIGTEHLLLGLLGEPDGVAGRALSRFGLTLATAREQVAASVKPGKQAIQGHIPFTPRAKKVLELALREALSLHHNYIGTEHILLGLIREGDGVGAQVIRDQCGDPLAVRLAVLDLVPAGTPTDERRWLRWRRATPTPSGIEPETLQTSGAVDASLEEAARLAGAEPVGSHHLLLATLADPNSTAARVLATFGVDLDQARDALRDADVTGTSDERAEDAGRRRMQLRVAEDRVVIEAVDEGLVVLGRRALDALAARPDATEEADTISGADPASVSMSDVWSAIEASLHDIRRRADTGVGEPAEPDQEATEPTGE